MQIPNGSVSSFLLTYVTISGVCVLCADSSRRIFYLNRFVITKKGESKMKKRVTNDDIAEFIGEKATKIRTELENQLKRALAQLWIEENEFLETLTKTQRESYYKLLEKQKIICKWQNDLIKKD